MQDRTSSLLGAILTTDEELFVHSGFAKASTLLVFEVISRPPYVYLKEKIKSKQRINVFIASAWFSYLKTVKSRASQSYY